MAGKPFCGRCNKPKSKCKCGRPTVITDDVIVKLEDGFQNDFTIEEACAYAGVSADAYYDRRTKDKKFAERMDRARMYLFILAKKNLAQEIKDGNKYSNKWILERRQRKLYSLLQEIDHTTDGRPIYLGLPPSQFKKAPEDGNDQTEVQ